MAIAQAQFNLDYQTRQSELELSCIAGLRLLVDSALARDLKAKAGIKQIPHAYSVPCLGYLVRATATLQDPDERSRILDAVIAVANSMQVARTNRFRTLDRGYGWFERVFPEGDIIQGNFRPGRSVQQFLSDATQREYVKTLQGEPQSRADREPSQSGEIRKLWWKRRSSVSKEE